MSLENPIKIYGAECLEKNYKQFIHVFLPYLRILLLSEPDVFAGTLERPYDLDTDSILRNKILYNKGVRKVIKQQAYEYEDYEPEINCFDRELPTISERIEYIENGGESKRDEFLKSMGKLLSVKGGYMSIENNNVRVFGYCKKYGRENNFQRSQIQTQLQEFINQNRKLEDIDNRVD